MSLTPEDFKQLPQDGAQFERLVCQLLEVMGYRILEKPAVGADGGRDILFELVLKDDIREVRQRVVAQCKHFAHSGRAVGDQDVGVWWSAMTRCQAHGYLLITDTAVTENLSRSFREFSNNAANHGNWADFWDVGKLTTNLNKYPELRDSFFTFHPPSPGPYEVSAAIVVNAGAFLSLPGEPGHSFWDVGCFQAPPHMPDLTIRADGEDLASGGVLKLPGGNAHIEAIHTRSNGVDESALEVSQSACESLLKRSVLYDGETDLVAEDRFDYVLRLHSGRVTATMLQTRDFWQRSLGASVSGSLRFRAKVAHRVSVEYQLVYGDVLKLVSNGKVLWSSEQVEGLKKRLEIEVAADDANIEKLYCYAFRHRRDWYWVPMGGTPPSQP